MSRTLGKTNIEISEMGLGCWAIGGEMYLNGQPDNYGTVNDDESIRALKAAYEGGDQAL